MGPFISSRTTSDISPGSRELPIAQTLETFRLLVEHATDIVTVLNEDGTIRYENPRVTDILGYLPEERIGLDAFSFIHPDDVGGVQAIFSILLQEENSTHSATFRYCHKDGSWRHLEAIGVNLLADPAVEGVLVNCRDITHLVENEARLKEKEKELAAAQRISKTGSWRWDLNTESVYWSDEMYRIYGLRPQSEDITFNIFLSFAATADDKNLCETTVKQALKKKQSFFYVHTIKRRDGLERKLESRGKVVMNSAGEAVRVVGVCCDITEEWQVREELERSYEELEKRVKERTEDLSKANARLKEERSRADFLTQAGGVLSSSLDYEETLKNISSLVVPHFADWCAIDMIDEHGELHNFRVEHRDADKVAWAQEIHSKYPPEKSADNGVYEAVRERRTLLFSKVTDEMLKEIAKDEEHLHLLREVGMSSVMIVPLVSERAAFGAITFIRTSENTERLYTDDDIPFVGRLAHQAELAIRNAQLYMQAHTELKKRRELERKWMRTYRELNKANKLLEHHIEELEYAKEEIKNEKVKDEAILESIGEGLIVVDENDRVVLANRAAEILLRGERQNFLGKHSGEVLKMTGETGEVIPMKRRPCGQVGTNRTAQISVSDNRYYERSDGTRFPVSVTAAAILSEGRLRGKVIVFRDGTHEKQIDEAKSEFISIASHQLRTPLSTINWYAETLLMQHENGSDTDKKREKYLTQIHVANQRLIRLVNSLLNASRLELGTVVVEPQPVHVVNLIKETLGDLRADIEGRQISIKEIYDGELPHVQLDPKITQVVVQNLISNAVKYIPEERQEKWVRVRVFAGTPPSKKGHAEKRTEEGVVIEIADNGYGISRGDRKKIFGKFFRCDVTRESNQEGSGLGLYIAKQLIELMGGKIWLRSRVDRGTRFYIYLPQERTRAQLPLQQEKIEQ